MNFPSKSIATLTSSKNQSIYRSILLSCSCRRWQINCCGEQRLWIYPFAICNFYSNFQLESWDCKQHSIPCNCVICSRRSSKACYCFPCHSSPNVEHCICQYYLNASRSTANKVELTMTCTKANQLLQTTEGRIFVFARMERKCLLLLHEDILPSRRIK